MKLKQLAMLFMIACSLSAIANEQTSKSIYTCKMQGMPTLIQDAPCPDGYETRSVQVIRDELALNDDVCGCSNEITQCCDETLSKPCKCD
jgi:hypothetical protein